MLTPAELADARRFCGYPAFGGPAMGQGGWRFYTAYGALEFRLANLQDVEEAALRRMLAQCGALETAVPEASDTLGTASAGLWERNPGEVADRLRLLDSWRRRICGFRGVAGGRGLGNPNCRGVGLLGAPSGSRTRSAADWGRRRCGSGKSATCFGRRGRSCRLIRSGGWCG